ncbi:hypothetical protein Adt_39416 [Abeliophyllum distichum]|uniref:Uncharacterized protein n=1 Tax=Abeliophyllum distichum TaxID=126358 RepID=A0ABD1Q589_9LAMI
MHKNVCGLNIDYLCGQKVVSKDELKAAFEKCEDSIEKYKLGLVICLDSVVLARENNHGDQIALSFLDNKEIFNANPWVRKLYDLIWQSIMQGNWKMKAHELLENPR